MTTDRATLREEYHQFALTYLNRSAEVHQSPRKSVSGSTRKRATCGLEDRRASSIPTLLNLLLKE